MRWPGIIVSAVLFVACGLLASPAFCHAALTSSDPADGAMIATAPAKLTLVFNEPVSALVLRLLRPDGSAQRLDNPGGRHQSIDIPVSGAIEQGTHVLSWRVISLDGHPVGGTVAFSVGAPSTAPPLPQPRADSVTGALWFVKLVIYLALFVATGGGFFTVWVARSEIGKPVLAKPVLVMSALVAGAAIALAVGLQGADALGLPLSSLRSPTVWQTGIGTAFGATAMAAAIALAAALLGVVTPRPIVARTMSLLGLIGTGVALAASGHASAAEPQTLMRPAVFVHTVAVAFWIGALMPLGAALRTADGVAVLARFSRIIPWALGGLVVSGATLAIVQVAAVSALPTTAYGQVLSAKLVLVLLLLALAAWNRYRSTPAVTAGIAGATRKLRQAIVAELAIVALILGLAASWRFTPPPRALALAAAQPALLHIHTADAMADVRFEPGRAGVVSASVALMTGDFAGLDAKELQLTIENRSVGVEAISRQAVKGTDGVWRVEQLPVPKGGRWDVRLDILITDFRKIVLEDGIDVRGPKG